MQNIYLYIGDNATGKTRLLKKIIKESVATSEMVVTNISDFKMPNVPDAHKKLMMHMMHMLKVYLT